MRILILAILLSGQFSLACMDLELAERAISDDLGGDSNYTAGEFEASWLDYVELTGCHQDSLDMYGITLEEVN